MLQGQLGTMAKSFFTKVATIPRGNRVDENLSVKPAGVITVFGTFALLLFIAVTQTPDLSQILAEMQAFFTGDVETVKLNHTTFLQMIPIILLTVVIELPLGIATAYLALALVGKATNHSVRNMIPDMKGKPIFQSLFFLVFVEEVIFRWLLIGQPMKIEGLSHGVGFYVVLLFANVSFALIHLYNYKNEEDRQKIRVVPQFIGGMMFSFVFVKYGLVASCLAHFASNAIIFSRFKLQNTNWVDAALIILHGAMALIAWNMMDKPITDATIWFNGEPIYAIPGWTTRDYVLFALFVNSCFNLVADLLLYDKNQDEKKVNIHPIHYVWIAPIAALLGLGVIYCAYWLVGLGISDIPFRILVCSLLLTAVAKNHSLSSAQRAFWVAVPTSYVSIAIFESLGFSGAWWYAIISMTIGIPQLVLSKFDD